MVGSSRVSVASWLWWLPLTMTGLVVDRGSRMRWLAVPALVAFTTVVSTLGKVVVRRPRPSCADVRRDVPFGLASSFPSTHSAWAWVIASWTCRSPWGHWRYLIAAGVGYLRVRQRAHYRSDVLAGSFVGYAIGRCAVWITTLLTAVIAALHNARGVPANGRKGGPSGPSACRRMIAR